MTARATRAAKWLEDVTPPSGVRDSLYYLSLTHLLGLHLLILLCGQRHVPDAGLGPASLEAPPLRPLVPHFWGREGFMLPGDTCPPTRPTPQRAPHWDDPAATERGMKEAAVSGESPLSRIMSSGCPALSAFAIGDDARGGMSLRS